ncbi:phosphodiester glycosidase family protein [Legionella sp. D16C41]|uniref:phosphodiester glycosidase family protein n=1 Tax=Legionella sp. D16C41 TaxID=3402688 RepID=UPI003AF740A2
MPSKTIELTKWLRQGLKAIFTVLFITILLNYAIAAANWQRLGPGLLYQDLNFSYLSPWSHIHVFLIDLKSNKLSSIMAKDLALKNASAEEYAEHSKSLITINGGFFDHNFHPLGLRINDKKQQSPLKQISWWGVFYIKHDHAYLTSVNQFKRSKQIDFAVQSGPRLIIHGQIPPLKPGRAERSALGITPEGQVVMLVTENSPLSTTELAQLMQAPPLNCIHALNLDGGSSSQLHAAINNFHLNVHGFSNVSDAIIVQKKIN